MPSVYTLSARGTVARFTISNIIELCSKVQMIWVNATRYVTSMEDSKTFAFLASIKTPRSDVCADHSSPQGIPECTMPGVRLEKS